MTLSPILRRAVDAKRAARVVEMKARYVGRIERIQRAVEPALGNGELALAFELPVTAIGRYVSVKPRFRTALPDRFTRALIDFVCDGDGFVAVRGPAVVGGRREVLLCTAPEALRLGGDWDVVNVAGRPLARTRATDWEQDDVWDMFDDAPMVAPEKGPPLPWRRLGPPQDPLWLSPLGLGGMRLSTAGRPDEAAAVAVLHGAWDAGLDWVDTANVYARDEADLGHNEALIRRALQSWPGEQPVRVATKGGLTRRGTRWLPDGRPESLRAACEASLKALGVERIDLYQLHAVDGRVPLAESVGALAALRDEGKIRHVGLCNVTAAQLAEARSMAPIVSVQNPCSVLDSAALRGMVAACAEAGVAFIAHSPLGGFRKVPRLRVDPGLRQVAERHDATPLAVALAWLLQAGPHVFAIPGATRLESVEASAAALRLRLTADDFATLAGRVPDGPLAPAPDPGDVAVIMGSPAAGKSSAVQPFLDRGYLRLNRDELGGSLDGLIPRLTAAAESGARRFVLDNTYGTRKSRAGLLEAAARFDLPARAIWLDVPPEAAAFHAARRFIERHGRLLSPAEIEADEAPNAFPPAVIRRYAQSFEPPSLEEGFAGVRRLQYRRRLSPERYRNKALILDYDGTLRVTKSGEIYPRDPDDVQVLPGRAEVLQRYRDAGYLLLGVSNQSGVASKRLSLEAAQACFARTHALLGLDIEVEFCPHVAGRAPACFCRKPMPGIGVLFIERHQLDPAQCIMVGDLDSDRGFAEAAGFEFVTADDFFSRP